MRPDFLVHWTGKDISLDSSSLDDALRQAYVDRLAGIVVDGFWMTTPIEYIEGYNGSGINYKIPMTCFTEIRLSQTQLHARRYGLLGVGVTRRFVLERLGGPVHYVRNHPTECVIGNAQELLNVLNTLGRPDLIAYFGVNASFIKNMSDPGKDDFTYLDEQEWRIVHTHRQTHSGALVATGLSKPPYRIPVQQGDVRIIVFPDDQTRVMAHGDSRLQRWLQAPTPLKPILLTLQECEHF